MAAAAERERMADARRLEEAAKRATVEAERERLAKEVAEAKAKVDAAAEVTRLANVEAKRQQDAQVRAAADAESARQATADAAKVATEASKTADKAKAQADKADAKAEGKATGQKTTTTTPKTPEPTAAVAPTNLQAQGTGATAKQSAAMLHEFMAETTDPSATLRELLDLVRLDNKYTPQDHKAMAMALAVYIPSSKGATKPATLPDAIQNRLNGAAIPA